MSGTTIKVTFVDDATGESIGVAEMPAPDIPDSFDIPTTLSISEAEWSVVDASPITRAEYEKAGALTLRLRRIEKLDPKDILFSLPSICDAIPGTGDQPVSGADFILGEDDWRQFEFVSSVLRPEADLEMAKIRRIQEEANTSHGWREVHVREKPEAPLALRITLEDLAVALRIPAKFAGVAYRESRSRIIDGYCVRMDGGPVIYGLAPRGIVEVIAFEQYWQSPPSADSIATLKSVARDLNLDLVYWTRCTRANAGDPMFDYLFTN